MQSELIPAVAQAHPLQTRPLYRDVHAGTTIAEIVSGFDLPDRFGLPIVQMIRGGNITTVPLDMWAHVRPKTGTRVEIGYPVEGPAAALLATVAFSAAAPWVAGTAFGLTVGTIGYSLTVAAVSIVGGLVINALIPPVQPQGGSRDAPNYSITSVANAENRYGIYPKVLGRHRIFPPKTALGFSETVGKDIYFRGRMTFGWGPVALEDLRIGTTPIDQFEGVEVEFLNVDQATTLANYPALANITRAWRQGTEKLTLCPDDVSEDAYNVKTDQHVPVIRVTRERSESAAIDISFPGGLVRITDKGGKVQRDADYRFRYRPLGSSQWLNGGSTSWWGKTTAFIRFTHTIRFPEPGEYEIEITRLDDTHEGDTQNKELGFLTAIRSFRSGELPSHDGIAEIAFRIKASDELNGQVDSLNAIVQQMAQVWTGSGWTAPQPVRHPAWVYLDAIRGGHLRRPVEDSRIDLAAFKAWADEEPHWTCDYVIDSETRVADVLDVIAASGRARRALTDLQWSIIRDGAAGPIRQVFSPRNSWGFKGSVAFPRPIHALRCLVRSERLDWEQDEVTVYADGYGPETASEFETLELPGVVITKADEDEGNAWRLGRYHLAQAILRPETYEWHADWEHMRVTRGDLVQLVHDVPMAGVGAARIKHVEADGGTLVSLTLDEVFDFAQASFRLTVRSRDGERYAFTAMSPADPATRVWTRTAGDVDATAIHAGDLVVIEETSQEAMEVLVTGIYPDGVHARITGVPAAPAVLEADQGRIPAYDPVITAPRDSAQRGPALPDIRSVVSDETTMLRDQVGLLQPRIAVYLNPVATTEALGAHAQLRWRVAEGDNEWEYGAFHAIGDYAFFTGPLETGTTYEVEVRTVGPTGRTRGWVSGGAIPAQTTDAPPPDVTGLSVVPSEHQVQLTWDLPQNVPDLFYTEIRHTAAEGGNWNASVLLDRIAYPGTSARFFARSGTYFARWVDRGGAMSPNAASAYISSNRIHAANAVETLQVAPDWTGTHDGTEVSANDALILARAGADYVASGVWHSTQVVDLGASYPVTITPFIEVSGLSLNEVMAAWTSLAEVDALAGSNPGAWGVAVDVSVSEDGATWSEWTEIAGGEFTGRHFKFRARLSSSRTDVTPVITDLAFVLDMPDRVDGIEDVHCPAGGLRVDYDPPFRNIPSVVVTPREAPTGARLVISNKSRTGFNIRFFNSSGSGIALNFDWVARGYGRETT